MSLKKDLIDKQARFWVLMAGGATLTGASEAVGVSRATGRKWRQATGGRIPRKRPAPSGRFLSLEEGSAVGPTAQRGKVSDHREGIRI